MQAAKIVIIEDDQHIRDEVADWLRFEGYEVIGAENGRVGLEATIREVPDLILCDIAMPEMDGRRVLLEVRSNPLLNRIPFIFVTASASRELVRQGMDMGADDYIVKPFSHAEILNAVRSRLEKHASQDIVLQDQLEVLSSELAEEREKRRLKSRLVAMFSHDFRNPLASILSSIELLRTYETRLSQEQKRGQLDRMERSIRLLIQMLDDMLLVAQMESGRLNYDPQLVDVSDLTKGIVTEFQFVYKRTHKLHFHSNVHHLWRIDPMLFRQILNNLISNAVKYSPSGGDVEIDLTEHEETLELVVEDHGIGIPEEDIPHLIEPFHRASNAIDIKGTGLGLSIVKQAAHICGGTVHVDSTLGEGTRFVVTLPRTHEPEE